MVANAGDVLQKNSVKALICSGCKSLRCVSEIAGFALKGIGHVSVNGSVPLRVAQK